MTAETLAALGAAASAVQIAIGLLFLGAGIQKLVHWQEFRGVVAAYRLVPSHWAAAVAAVIAPLEVLLGVASILRWAMPFTAFAIAAMLIVFAAAMGINIRRGRTTIDCGCFRTNLRQPLQWRLVTRNLVCALAMLIAGAVPSVPVTLLWVLALPAGAALFSLYVALNGVWGLDASRRAALGRS